MSDDERDGILPRINETEGAQRGVGHGEEHPLHAERGGVEDEHGKRPFAGDLRLEGVLGVEQVRDEGAQAPAEDFCHEAVVTDNVGERIRQPEIEHGAEYADSEEPDQLFLRVRGPAHFNLG